jgi:hypothetical protein
MRATISAWKRSIDLVFKTFELRRATSRQQNWRIVRFICLTHVRDIVISRRIPYRPRFPSPTMAATRFEEVAPSGRYHDSSATPGGKAFAIGRGEFSIYEQYVSAIDAAQSSIYVEDQAIGRSRIAEVWSHALSRYGQIHLLETKRPSETSPRAACRQRYRRPHRTSRATGRDPQRCRSIYCSSSRTRAPSR